MHGQQAIKTQIDELNELAFVQIEKDISILKKCADEAIALCSRLEEPYVLGRARAEAMQLEWLLSEGQMLRVIEIGEALKNVYNHHPPDKWFVATLYCLGVAFHHTGQIAFALATHQEQLYIARQLGLKAEQASALRRIGVAHSAQGMEQLALKYYEQSAEIYGDLDIRGGIAGNLINSAVIYLKNSKFDLALEYAHAALIAFDEAEHLSGQVAVHNNLAKIYVEIQDLESAGYHAKQALKLARKSNNPNRVISSLNTSAVILNAEENYAQALTYLLQALALAIEVADINMQANCHETLSDTYAMMGNYQAALVAHHEFHKLKVRMMEDASQMHFEGIEVIYQTREAQREAEQERQLREEERHYYEQISQMKDEWLSTASHDLKNPLGTIMLMAALLRHEISPTNEKALAYLSNIDTSAHQMRELIINLLDLARLEAPVALEIKPHDIVDLLKDVCREIKARADEKGVFLTCNITANDIICRFDKLRVRQVLLNLLSNALKYTPPLGHITIELMTEDGEVLIQINDTGIGIPENDLDHIFERFYRVEDEAHQAIEGTGLGLAICQTIIDQHHGRIWANSEVGVGSSFYFTLPFNEVFAKAIQK